MSKLRRLSNQAVELFQPKWPLDFVLGMFCGKILWQNLTQILFQNLWQMLCHIVWQFFLADCGVFLWRYLWLNWNMVPSCAFFLQDTFTGLTRAPEGPRRALGRPTSYDTKAPISVQHTLGALYEKNGHGNYTVQFSEVWYHFSNSQCILLKKFLETTTGTWLMSLAIRSALSSEFSSEFSSGFKF